MIKLLKENGVCFFLVVGIFLYIIVMATLFNISGITLVKFLVLNIFSVFLPGIALLYLCNIKLSRVGFFCTSYLLGYAFLVIEYFISEVFNRKISFVIVNGIVTVISVVVIVTSLKAKRTVGVIKKTRNETMEVFFLFLFGGLNILAYAANFLGTDVVSVFEASRDMQYWVNNTVALKIAWPADNLFMVGNSLNYHYFSNIPIAFLCEVYKIDVFTMSFPLYAFTKTIVMVGAVQFLLDSITEDKRISFLGYIFLIFSTGAETASIVTFVQHTLLAPFGFDIGYAYGMFFIGFMLRQWKTEEFDWKNFVGMIIAWIMCVGAKAPLAVVILLFPALICLYWLIHKKITLALVYGLSILGSFLVICKYCVGMFSVVRGNSAWRLGIYGLEHLTYIGEFESWDIIGDFFVKLVKSCPWIAVIIRTISLNPFLIVGMMVSCIWIFFKGNKKIIHKKDVYLQLSLVITSLWGICLWHLINAGGSSEMYFAMATLIPIAILIINTLVYYLQLEGIKLNKYILLNSLKLSGSIVLGLLLVVSSYRYMCSAWSGTGALRSAQIGIKNLYNASCDNGHIQQISIGIRNTDVKALSWIRDNATQDSLVITDKAVMTDNLAYYMYGIFCERQQYLEGTNMLEKENQNIKEEISRREELIISLYNNGESAIERAKEEGIDYIVQTIDVTPGFRYDEEKLELVEASSTMNVYKIK